MNNVIKELLKEFNNVQYVNAPMFDYDMKNLSLIIKGYWATDRIYTVL
jgi:hypothetical protein